MTIEETIKILQKLAAQKSFRARFNGHRANLPRYTQGQEFQKELFEKSVLLQKESEALYTVIRGLYSFVYEDQVVGGPR